MKRVKRQSLSMEVKKEITDYIKANHEKLENKLPTEEQLAALLGVSRITIRTALNDLANEGLIFRRQGKGTFINVQAVNMKVSLNPATLYINMISNCGFSPDIQVLQNEFCLADANLANKLNVPIGQRLILVQKIFYADENPCCFCQDYFDASMLKKDLDMEAIKHYPDSLFNFFKEYLDHPVIWDKTELTTVTTLQQPSLGHLFHIVNTVKAFLLLECINYDTNDKPVFYAKEYIDTSYIQFNLIRQKHYQS